MPRIAALPDKVGTDDGLAVPGCQRVHGSPHKRDRKCNQDRWQAKIFHGDEVSKGIFTAIAKSESTCHRGGSASLRGNWLTLSLIRESRIQVERNLALIWRIRHQVLRIFCQTIADAG